MQSRDVIADLLPSGLNRRSEHEVARSVADAAGQLLLGIRGGLTAGASADDVRRNGDRGSHELLLELLGREFPEDEVLSEEAAITARPDAERRWIIDPLDGTREFGEPQRDDWAVHVALVERGALVAGAVAMPARGVTYATRPAPSLAKVRPRAMRIAVSRTRPAGEAQELAERFGGELVPMGSAGVKVMAVVSGAVDVYLHSGGQYVWDSAAPVAVALAAGLHASRVDGSDLVYGSGTTWLPDLVICRPELRDSVLGTLETLRV